MSFNTTFSPFVIPGALPTYIPIQSTPGLVALGVVAAFLLAILLNVASQLLLPRDPTLPPLVFHWVPIIGSTISYGTDPINFFFRCREKYGDIFTFILLGRRMTVALGPKGNNFILGGKLSQVSAEDAYTHLMTPIFGPGVAYDVPNHVFMEQKRFLKFGLSTENFRAYVPMIEGETMDMLSGDSNFKAYQQGDKSKWGSFHAFKAMSELTILTASRTLQGPDVRGALDKSFADIYHDLDGGLTPLNFLFPNLPLPSYRRRDKAQQAMSNFFVNIMRKRATSNEEHEHDILAALQGQTYKNGREIGERETAHLMIGLLMAGQHTSSATSSWILLHLAKRPDIQEALYEEQKKFFGNPDGTLRPFDYNTFKQLSVLDSVIRETLRIHAPIHSLIRKVKSDMVVPGTVAAPSESTNYVVPQGYFLLASPSVSQMDPKVWKNPNEWDPSRWSDPTGGAAMAYADEDNGEKVDYGFGVMSKGTESPYQPFGAGRHRCIGEHFAYLQIGTIVATLVRHVELKLANKNVPEHNYATMITLPKDPCDILYRKRA